MKLFFPKTCGFCRSQQSFPYMFCASACLVACALDKTRLGGGHFCQPLHKFRMVGRQRIVQKFNGTIHRQVRFQSLSQSSAHFLTLKWAAECATVCACHRCMVQRSCYYSSTPPCMRVVYNLFSYHFNYLQGGRAVLDRIARSYQHDIIARPWALWALCPP